VAPSGPPVRLLSELAALVSGEIAGDAQLRITGVNGLEAAAPSELSFYANSKYRAELERTRAGAILVGPEVKSVQPRTGVSYVKVPHPQLAFAKISCLFNPRPLFAPGVSPRAHVHPEAGIDPQATVMAGATVERGARIGAHSVLFPGVFVGQEARVGEDCLLYPNATVRERCEIGARVILHPSCVIGADGFGFAFDPEALEHFKIPQAGIARIEDDVEVGACSCVDRATFGETVIGKGSKIDNLVQIAHNVKIGALSIVCGQTGISGSTEIGAGVVLAGQVGVAGHIRIGDRAKVSAQTGIAQDVADGDTVSGTPAMDHQGWLRSSIAFRHLGDLVKEIRELRTRLETLEKRAPTSVDGKQR
jgi:UDP-3-O-[3-hydroxymyristoyl] glucosamine N-acyltransferase